MYTLCVDPFCLSLELFGSFDPYKTKQTYFIMEWMSKLQDNLLLFFYFLRNVLAILEKDRDYVRIIVGYSQIAFRLS